MTHISRIDPPCWYVGMKCPRLQLMIHGEGVGRTQHVSLSHTRARIERIVRTDSPNWLLLYLDLSKAEAGTFSLQLDDCAASYTLHRRELQGEERQGFTNADVLYLLMPDRFASSGRTIPDDPSLFPYSIDRSEPSLRHGGDLEGLRRHLDYFVELGVTALWLTPVFENNAPDHNKQSCYHGYAVTDYYRIDPRLGTLEDYRRLVDEAHAKGLKVVMDMIFNHCGVNHPWMQDPPMSDWFNSPDTRKQTSYKLTPVLDPYASRKDLSDTVEGWFVASMPDLNQRNTHLMTYLSQSSYWWIETTGIDGIRMDTYPFADREAMADWMAALNEEYPHFNTVGETWVTEPAYTAAWQKDSRLTDRNSHLKTVMDFALFERLNYAKGEETDGWWNGMNRVYNCLTYDYLYADPSHVLAFIDNHDTDRFLANDVSTDCLKQALALLLTMNRTPQLYYGTEILMRGTKSTTDGDVRKDFPGGFPGDLHNAFTPRGRSKAENEMFRWLSRLLHFRQGNRLITEGRQLHFIPHHGVYALARELHGTRLLTLVNGTSKHAAVDIDRYSEVVRGARQATNVMTGRTLRLAPTLRMRPRQTLILLIEEG